MRVHAIVNPAAGGGYASEIYRSVVHEFRKLDPSVFITSGPGEATSIAAEAVQQGATHILCIGGDGTLNEVVQAIAHTDAILVPVSAGTGSDFVKTLGLNDLGSVMEYMLNGSHRSIDLGRVSSSSGSRYFLNILEVGFGASVMKRVNARKKVRGGSSFTSAVISLIPSFRQFPVTVRVDGGEESFGLAEMVVANGRYFGGGMLAAPAAELDDGMMDIHIVRGVGRIQMMMKLRKLRDGTYVRDPSVQSYRASSIEISGDAPVEMDGEDLGTLPISIDTDRGALKVVGAPLQK